jgi:hypothetical protein
MRKLASYVGFILFLENFTSFLKVGWLCTFIGSGTGAAL